MSRGGESQETNMKADSQKTNTKVDSQETNAKADSQKTNTIAESLPLKEACIEVIATILEMASSDQELVPPSFVGTVTRLMKDYIFSLSLATNGLHILTSLYPHRTPFSLCFPIATYQSAFKTEETITCLQLICYATQSQECRALTQSLLASLEAPFQISPDVPLRSDALEDILFAGLICQLDAKERSVLLDVLKVCGDALALSQQRFLHAFELKQGMTRLLGILRYHTDDEVLHPSLELLRCVIECRRVKEAEAISIVTVVYKVLHKKEACRECAKYLTYLVRFLSSYGGTRMCGVTVRLHAAAHAFRAPAASVGVLHSHGTRSAVLHGHGQHHVSVQATSPHEPGAARDASRALLACTTAARHGGEPGHGDPVEVLRGVLDAEGG